MIFNPVFRMGLPGPPPNRELIPKSQYNLKEDPGETKNIAMEQYFQEMMESEGLR